MHPGCVTHNIPHRSLFDLVPEVTLRRKRFTINKWKELSEDCVFSKQLHQSLWLSSGFPLPSPYLALTIPLQILRKGRKSGFSAFLCSNLLTKSKVHSIHVNLVNQTVVICLFHLFQMYLFKHFLPILLRYPPTTHLLSSRYYSTISVLLLYANPTLPVKKG